MAQELTKNFAVSTVATAPSPATSGTSLVVAAGEGSRFDSAVDHNAIICPADEQPTPANAEIVRVTAISTDTFTITRQQESSSARTVVVGDRIYAGVTAKTLSDMETLMSSVAAFLVGQHDADSTSVHGIANTADLIADTIVDAKGDLIAATAADTVARLGPVGANETALVAASGESTGLKWAVPLGAQGTWVTIAQSSSSIAQSAASGLQGLGESGSSAPTGSSTTSPVIPLTASEYAMTGRTTQLRVAMALATNATAPAITFTGGISVVTSAGASNTISLTFASQTGPTVARASPAASSVFRDFGSAVSFPSDGVYALTCNLSNTHPANARTIVALYLQLRHI